MSVESEPNLNAAVDSFQRIAEAFQLSAPADARLWVNGHGDLEVTIFGKQLDSYEGDELAVAGEMAKLYAVNLFSFQKRLSMHMIARAFRYSPDADLEAASITDTIRECRVGLEASTLVDELGKYAATVVFGTMTDAEGNTLGKITEIEHETEALIKSLDIITVSATPGLAEERHIQSNIVPANDADLEAASYFAYNNTDDPEQLLSYLNSFFTNGANGTAPDFQQTYIPFVADEQELQRLAILFYEKGRRARDGFAIKDLYGTDVEDVQFFERLITPS